MSHDIAAADTRSARSERFFMRIMSSLMIGMSIVFTCLSFSVPPRRGYNGQLPRL
eukprot:CAMPEP_0172799782 /NCGR_PEP_ID=MMETSP1075-20121228/2097_1 /TAXON_ID=2916 /ORGANISM="Ceratium fusus, Strain PA161109" /LENGTH=54 /DNA_ID=CAMNT_0013637531 /DNA_START=105 /DNA_END=266 /DNA_ORIENTATION=+